MLIHASDVSFAVPSLLCSVLPEQVNVVLPAIHIPCWWTPALGEPAWAPDDCSGDGDSRPASALWHRRCKYSVFMFMFLHQGVHKWNSMSKFKCIGQQLWLNLVCTSWRLYWFSPYEPYLVVCVTLSDVWHYLPGPSTPNNSLEGQSRW